MTQHWQIRKAVRIIKKGGVIAYPTESVFGLGCDPANPKAIQHLLKLKHRSYKKGLIIVASHLQQAEPFIKPLSDELSQRVEKSVGQHITWLLPAKDEVSELLCGEFPQGIKKIAIRITPFPLIKTLCEQLNSPLISTSANISGKKMTYSSLQVRLQFQDRLDLILNGKLGQQRSPSEIRDAVDGKIFRTKI